ncbi:hypothetical protein IJ750_07665 [bacterium]|nr:hypothetical protein [bacterium]
MIKEVSFTDSRINFREKPEKKQNEESTILPNTLGTRVNQKYDKTMSAIIEYPVKGLRGDVNSDFYEFLSMGIIPYLAGSAMFMGLFNLVNKHLSPKSRIFAGDKGKKMALGVVLYGVAKTLANDLVTRPVAWSTGVDIELPYRNVYYPLPTKPGAEADIFPQHQQRKVFDSREFFRKDLLAKDENYGVKYYDNVAKKLGLGDNLNDSVTETTPIIQSIISATKTAKSLSSYAWAAAGVGLAMQSSWSDFFNAVSQRKRHISRPGEGLGAKISGKMKNFGNNFVDISKAFGKAFLKGCKTLWTGEKGTSGYMKHAGKAWIVFSTVLTAGSVANVIYKAKHMGKLANKNIIDKNQESTVI